MNKQYFSQNNEEQIVKEHFFGKNSDSLTLLDIGANDGQTFSNSLGLIRQGWTAHLLEPSVKAYTLLSDLHKDNPRVFTYGFGISDVSGTKAFWESGSYENKGEDIALMSCIDPKEKERWKDKVEFQQTQAHFYTFLDFMMNPNVQPGQIFDFITIDAEGSDWDILSQINLDAVQCRCLCVEYNSLPLMRNLFTDYAAKFGMRLREQNAENLIFVR